MGFNASYDALTNRGKVKSIKNILPMRVFPLVDLTF